MENDFPEWLAQELQKRDMSQVELARKSGIAPAQISRILSGQRGAESKTLRLIAAAFKMPAETVFRAAGLLPELPNVDEWVEEMDYKLRLLPMSYRSVAKAFIESLLNNEETASKPRAKPRQSHKGVSG